MVLLREDRGGPLVAVDADADTDGTETSHVWRQVANDVAFVFGNREEDPRPARVEPERRVELEGGFHRASLESASLETYTNQAGRVQPD